LVELCQKPPPIFCRPRARVHLENWRRTAGASHGNAIFKDDLRLTARHWDGWDGFSGWWLKNHLERYEFVSWDDYSQTIMWRNSICTYGTYTHKIISEESTNWQMNIRHGWQNVLSRNLPWVISPFLMASAIAEDCFAIAICWVHFDLNSYPLVLWPCSRAFCMT
jgi:hypothetical protein